MDWLDAAKQSKVSKILKMKLIHGTMIKGVRRVKFPSFSLVQLVELSVLLSRRTSEMVDIICMM